jgi:CRP/FNR family transcriptional regulator, cyclic AMP receptor protein
MERQEALARAPIFSRLDAPYLNQLARLARDREFGAGDLILKQGEPGIALFVVQSGRVQIVRNAGQPEEQVLGEHGPGGFFGEMTLIDEYPRSASVRALEPTTCIGLTKVDFITAVRENPDIAIRMLREMSQRLREANRRAGIAADE